jgi:hypothetical protein
MTKFVLVKGKEFGVDCIHIVMIAARKNFGSINA